MFLFLNTKQGLCQPKCSFIQIKYKCGFTLPLNLDIYIVIKYFLTLFIPHHVLYVFWKLDNSFLNYHSLFLPPYSFTNWQHNQCWDYWWNLGITSYFVTRGKKKRKGKKTCHNSKGDPGIDILLWPLNENLPFCFSSIKAFIFGKMMAVHHNTTQQRAAAAVNHNTFISTINATGEKMCVHVHELLHWLSFCLRQISTGGLGLIWLLEIWWGLGN